MTEQTKAERFAKLAPKRMDKAITSIRSVGKLANTASYEYSEKQVKAMVKTLTDEMAAVVKSLESKTVTVEGGFKF